MTGLTAALLLSAVAPGCGQFFNGQYGKGAFFAVLFIFGRFVFLPLAVRIINFKTLEGALKFIYAFNIVYPLLITVSVMDAAYHGFYTPHTWTGFFYSAIAAFAVVAAHKGLNNDFIVYSMSGRRDMPGYILTSRKASQVKK